MSDKLQKLQELIKISNDGLSKEEFTSNFSIIINLIKKLQASNKEVVDGLDAKYHTVIKEVESNLVSDIEDLKKQAMDFCIQEMKKIKSGKDGEDGANGKDGKNPVDGKDGNTITNISTFTKAPLNAQKGDIIIVEDTGETYIFE